MSRSRFMRRLFLRKDGLSIAVMIASAQVIALIGAIPGFLLIQLTAELNKRQVLALAISMPPLFLLSFLTLLDFTWRSTASARLCLDRMAKGQIGPDPDPDLQLNAWREITGLTWRYGSAAILVIFTVNVLPAYIVSILQGNSGSSVFNPLSVESAPAFFVLTGGTAAMLGSVMLAVFLIGRFTLPARLLLVPTDFDTQLRGRAGTLVSGKFQSLILILITLTILLIAPIGFQLATRIQHPDSNPADMIPDLQVRSLLFSALALLLGMGYSLYASRSISDPIHELIETFDRIERGDLSARAPISATDELGIVTMQFNRMVTRLEKLQNQLEVQVEERTRQLTASNELGRVASSSLDPDRLLVNVMNLFDQQFDYYFAAMYLLDPSEKWAELREATGEAGKLLQQNHFRLEVAGKSPVGTAIREKAATVSTIESDVTLLDNNPLLPYTKSAIAVPLLTGDRVLGALEVQSTKPDDFNPDMVETLKNMAGQVTIALENARLFQEAERNILELRAIQQQYLLTGWSGFSGAAEELEYAVGDESDTESRKIEVPISLRDQVLGNIRLEANAEWTPEQKSLVDAVAAQAAIAVENARLVGETRQAAVRDRMLAEINSRIWASATIDAVLQTVVKELGRRLDASHVTVELTMDEPS